MPRSTVQKVLEKLLRRHAYVVQLIQRLQPNDRPKRADLLQEILTRSEEDNDHLKHVVFSDEAMNM